MSVKLVESIYIFACDVNISNPVLEGVEPMLESTSIIVGDGESNDTIACAFLGFGDHKMRNVNLIMMLEQRRK